MTGEPLTKMQNQRRPIKTYRYFNVGIQPTDRAALHDHISARFSQMLERGFVKEVEGLVALPGMHRDLPSMRCVGYRQVSAMLHDESTYSEMCERGIAATRQLAKRQITWMRRMDNLHRLDFAPRADDVERLGGFDHWMQSVSLCRG